LIVSWALIASKATLALNSPVYFRRVRLLRLVAFISSVLSI